MYPDLSYFFHDVFGSQVDNWTSVFKTFGLFLALTFLVSYYLIAAELKRKNQEGVLPNLQMKVSESSALKDGLINAIFGFILGFKLPYIYEKFAEFKVDPPSIVFSGEGNLWAGIIGGVLFGLYAFMMSKNKAPVKAGVVQVRPQNRAGDIILVAALFGILGSRLLSIFENWDSFIAAPMEQFLSGSGLTIYGGLILAFIAVFLYVKYLGINPIHMMDVAAPALLLGYGVGRLGCQFSGDGDWGIVNENPKPDWFVFPDWAWAYDYPRNVADMAQRGVKIPDCVGNFCTHLSPPVYPTPIYEIILAVISFFIVWSIRKKIKTPGKLFMIYMILTGLSRFWIEGIRVNPRYELFDLGWSMSQWISLLILLAGIIGFLLIGKKSTPKPDYTIPDLVENES